MPFLIFKMRNFEKLFDSNFPGRASKFLSTNLFSVLLNLALLKLLELDGEGEKGSNVTTLELLALSVAMS